MATTESWPPKSPRHALLSSPSGRQKYQEYKTGQTAPSPIKRAPGTPSLLDKLRATQANGNPAKVATEEEDEDEETLQLKLAAIEAKLKLKKLQQNKARLEENTRPQSSSSSVLRPSSVISRLEVPLSPTRRPQTLPEPRSPGRILLGIDKVLSAADVSLKRARTIGISPTKDRRMADGERMSSSSQPKRRHTSSKTPPDQTPYHLMSFSERMADVRQSENQKQEKAEAKHDARSIRFKLERPGSAQLPITSDRYTDRFSPRSPKKQDPCNTLQHKNFTSGSSDATRVLEKSLTLPNVRQTSTLALDQFCSSDEDGSSKGNASLFEAFSGAHLSSRILPHAFLKRTLPLDQYTIYKVPDLLKVVKSPTYEIPEHVNDYVVFGIIASKSSPMDQKARSDTNSLASNEWEKKWDDGSRNNKKFMVFTLTDLKWTVDLFLFDTAVPRYHRLAPGTVIAILNPTVMKPKKGREDTGAFSLALHCGEDSVLEIGSSKHLGYCKTMTKAGKECGSWVDASKTEICEWHLNAQIAKTQARRMGVNSGSNGFGGTRKGKGTVPDRFDRTAAPRSSAPIYNPEYSTARMIDMDTTNDPFIAEGQLSRDKEGRMQKRMANQEKERQIARQLATMSSGGAGGDYMRHRTGIQANGTAGAGSQRSVPPSESKISNVMNNAPVSSRDMEQGGDLLSRKRTAESVRLSPVKKTRFLTDRGIKEAGRESLGTPRQIRSRLTENNDINEDDDDYDDLDIV